MNKGVFITVRTNSMRLPQKALIDFSDGLTTIEYLIERVKHSTKADKIILCTTKEIEDNVLVDIAIRNEIDYYRGSVEDKLQRWKGASEKFDIDYIVTADGDDLFCEPKLFDFAFDQFDKSSPDFIQCTGIICGAFTYGIKKSALIKVCELKDTDDTEMMWVYFTDTGLFNVEELKNVSSNYLRNDIRMTLDYPEDLEFFKSVVSKSQKNNAYLHLDDILDLIDKYPDIKKINYFRQKEFLQNQKENINLKLNKNYL